MIKWCVIFTVVLGVFGAQAALRPLEALSMIESGNNDDAVGPVGEVSRFQIRPFVWKQYSGSENYQDPRAASAVARRHVQFLRNAFRSKTGRSPSNFDLYVMWNAGIGYYEKHDFSPAEIDAAVRERAVRFVNLTRYD